MGLEGIVAKRRDRISLWAITEGNNHVAQLHEGRLQFPRQV